MKKFRKGCFRVMIRGGNDAYHQPVLASEVVRLITTNPVGAYLDLTVGGGGHLKALGDTLDKKARLFGADKDDVAVERATQVLNSLSQQGRVIKGSFGDLAQFVHEFNENSFAGILLDLGLSSRQIDDTSRGFAFGADGPLDMRFDRSTNMTAADFVNEAEKKKLTEIIRSYGEEREAARIVSAIVTARAQQPITTTGQLAQVVKSVVNGPHQTKSLARVFQALRIHINQEMEELKQVLPAAVDRLDIGGRLAVISYHSLEDRLVKWFFREEANPKDDSPFALPEAQLPKPRLKLITKKPIIPTEEEIASNSRARSAKLRVAERVS